MQERKTALQAKLGSADEPPPLLHPSMADLYRSKVEELASELQREDTRLEASEILRGLIASIVLTRENGRLRIVLRGNLAAMFGCCPTNEKVARNRRPSTADEAGCGGGI